MSVSYHRDIIVLDYFVHVYSFCYSILVLIRFKFVRLQLEAAKAAAKLEFSVTGALGFRTIHQVSYEIFFVLIGYVFGFVFLNSSDLGIGRPKATNGIDS